MRINTFNKRFYCLIFKCYKLFITNNYISKKTKYIVIDSSAVKMYDLK